MQFPNSYTTITTHNVAKDVYVKHCFIKRHMRILLGLVRTSADATRSRALSSLIFSQDSQSPYTVARVQDLHGAYLLLRMSLDIFDIIINTTNICVFKFLWPLRLRWLLVLGLYMEVNLYFFNVSPFDWLQMREVGGLALTPKIHHTGWMTGISPADRPKSVRNRCVIVRIKLH